MPTPIEKYVAALHEGEQKRDAARERLVSGELSDRERAVLDNEITTLNSELERSARAINDELRALAQKGRAPRAPAQLDQVRDPDLKVFCAQVKATLERLQRLAGQNDARLATERANVAKERAEAKKIIRESDKRKRELDDEKKKLDKARKQLAEEKKKLEGERGKFERERDHFEEEKERTRKERGELDDKLEGQRDERRKLETQRKEIQGKLRTVKDAKPKAELEKRLAQLDGRGREIDRVIAQNQRARDERLRSIEQSMGREKDQLDDAHDGFAKETKRLEQESARLDDEDEKLTRALALEEERLDKARSLDAQLTKARV